MLWKIPLTQVQDWRPGKHSENHTPSTRSQSLFKATLHFSPIPAPCIPGSYVGSHARSRVLSPLQIPLGPESPSLSTTCPIAHRQAGALPVFRTGIYFSSKKVFSELALHRIHSQSMSWIYSWLDMSVMFQMGFLRSRFCRQEQMLFSARIRSQCF